MSEERRAKRGVGVGEGASDMPEFYSNVVGANISPWDVSLIFQRSAIPLHAQKGQEFSLQDTLRPIARVTLPLNLLPALIDMLGRQLEMAKAQGLWTQPVDLKKLEKTAKESEGKRIKAKS